MYAESREYAFKYNAKEGTYYGLHLSLLFFGTYLSLLWAVRAWPNWGQPLKAVATKEYWLRVPAHFTFGKAFQLLHLIFLWITWANQEALWDLSDSIGQVPDPDTPDGGYSNGAILGLLMSTTVQVSAHSE